MIDHRVSMSAAAAATATTAAPTHATALGKKDTVFSGKEKAVDVRHANILAAKAVAEVVRTSLGPKGMDKMIQSSDGEVIITNDGATILAKMEVQHPAAKMVCNTQPPNPFSHNSLTPIAFVLISRYQLVDVSKAQDVEAGDGTTSVVVMTGALLDAVRGLLAKGLHPSIVAESFQDAARESENILKSIAIPVNLSDRKALIDAVCLYPPPIHDHTTTGPHHQMSRAFELTDMWVCCTGDHFTEQ